MYGHRCARSCDLRLLPGPNYPAGCSYCKDDRHSDAVAYRLSYAPRWELLFHFMIVRGIKIPVASHRSFFKYFESFHALPTTTFHSIHGCFDSPRKSQNTPGPGPVSNTRHTPACHPPLLGHSRARADVKRANPASKIHPDAGTELGGSGDRQERERGKQVFRPTHESRRGM